MNNVLNDTSDGLYGKKWNIEGKDGMTFIDIENAIKQNNYRGPTHTSSSNMWKKTYMSWQLFFNGSNHFNNMVITLYITINFKLGNNA